MKSILEYDEKVVQMEISAFEIDLTENMSSRKILEILHCGDARHWIVFFVVASILFLVHPLFFLFL